MAQFAPIIKGGLNLAKAASFANNPTVSGGMSLAQAAVPYLTDDKTAQDVVGGVATGQKVYGALSGGMNNTATIGGKSLGMTGGQLSGGIGLLGAGYNMTQGMTDPEAMGAQVLGSMLMMSGNPYLMAAGAVMYYVGPMLQDEEQYGANVTGTGTAKWGDGGLQAPSIYHGNSIPDQAKAKEGNLGGYTSAIEGISGDTPTWKQLGLKGPEEMTSETFNSQIAKKEQELAEAKAKMESASANPYDPVMQADLNTYGSMVNNLNLELKDLQGKKAQYEAIAPYGLDTGKGNAYTIHDLAATGLPYSSGGMSGFGPAFNEGVGAVTQAAIGKFNSEIESVLSQMPQDQADAVRAKLKETNFDINYNKAWKKESVRGENFAKQLPAQFEKLGSNIYDQLWGTVEQEFGVSRDDILPLIQTNFDQPAILASQSVAAPALEGKTTMGGTLAGKTFGTGV